MKTTLLLLIILSISFTCKGQFISPDEYIDITKAVLSDNELVQNLIENSKFESHPIYTKDRIFILDTTFVNKEIIYNKNKPKFSITNYQALNTSYVNYWLTPINIEIKNNKAIYEFQTQALNYLELHNYIKGKIVLKKNNNCWIVKNTKIENYEFTKPKDLECFEKFVECISNFNRPRKSKTKNPFFGNWQSLSGNLYFEYFFTDDSIFEFNEVIEQGFYDAGYEVRNSILVIKRQDNSVLILKYEFISKEKIHLYEKNVPQKNDTNSVHIDFTIEKIKSRKYTLNKVKCWGVYNKNFDCYVYSTDYLRYRDAFYRRMSKYKEKNKL